MKKKMISIILTCILLTSALVGCGASGNSGDTGTAGNASADASAEAPSDSASDAGTDVGDTAAVSLDGLPAAVGEGEIKASPDFYQGIDLSDHYTVNMYLIGDTPNDWDRVLGLVNEYLKPYNTDLAVTFMSWSDYQTMYSLVLAGGEQVDLIFTAP